MKKSTMIKNTQQHSKGQFPTFPLLLLLLLLLILSIFLFSGCTLENPSGWDEKNSVENSNEQERIAPQAPDFDETEDVEKPPERPVDSIPAEPIESKPAFTPPQLSWTFTTGYKNVDLSMSSDGKLLAAGSYDGYLYLIDNLGNEIWRFKVKGSALGVGITGDGKYIVLTDTTTIFLLENKDNSEPVVVWKKVLEDEGLFKAADISRDGSIIAVGNDKGKVITFDENGEELWEYQVGDISYGVWDICISDNKHIAIASQDTYIHYLDESGKILWKRSQGRKSVIAGCSISKNEDLVAGAAWYNFAYVYDTSGNLRWKYQTKFDNNNVFISDNFIAISSMDKNIYLLNRQGKLLWNENVGAQVYDVVISDDEKNMAVSTRDKRILFYRLVSVNNKSLCQFGNPE